MAESTCDINRIFGDLAARVPDGPPGFPDFVFQAGILTAPPIALSSDRIIIRKTTHTYNDCCRADALVMYLSPGKSREMGVFLLACAFHGPAEGITLTLSHPESDIRRIIIPAGRLTLEDLPAGLWMVPFALNYYPAETRKHPWLYDCGTRSLPALELSNADDCIVTDEQWSGRDTARIWASNPGSLELAELMLNAGCSWNEVREYALEGDAGYRRVAPMSAELRIFLPGSDGWIYDGEDVPMDSSSGSGKQECDSYPATLDIPADALR